MTETQTYIIGGDLSTGRLARLWHISRGQCVDGGNGRRVSPAWCGKQVEVVVMRDSDPPDDETCAICWREAGGK